MSDQGSFLALDVGERRIGVALADSVAKIASPLQTLSNDKEVLDTIVNLVDEHAAQVVVVGLPRGLEGQETSQTKSVRQFAEKLEKKLKKPIQFQDEALSSIRAEEKLKSHKDSYVKEDIDMYAAAYILQEYLDYLTAQGATNG